MLNAIVGFAVRLRGVMIALAVLASTYGVLSLGRARLDVFPEFAPPQAIVQTEVPGFAPRQVETLVTQRLENALAGAGGLSGMRSKSLQGLSMITLTFRHGSDLQRVRQTVGERLQRVASELPAAARAPVLLPLSSSSGIVLTIGVTSSRLDALKLRTLADWTLKPQLLSVPGVSDVTVYGGGLRQLQIQVHPQALARYGLSMQQVAAAARRATGQAGGGFVENANQRIVLAPAGLAITPEQVAAVALKAHDGGVLRLGDVATVSNAAAPAAGAASIMGRPGVMLVVAEQYGADTVRLTRALDARLQSLKPALAAQHVTLYPALFRPANFIDAAVTHLRDALLIGAALVLLVLFVFLRHVRAALISVVAIPLSLLAAVVVLEHFGLGLNTMTLGGLAIAIGEVVDDAIIDVENIVRRLRLNRLEAAPLPAAQVVLAASLEVRGAVIYATFIVALVFVPVVTLSGVAGSLFAPLGIAYIAAIMASLVVALTVTPALALTLLQRTGNMQEPALQRRIKQRYERVLTRVERHPRALPIMVAVLCVAALAVLPFLQGSFLPKLREGHYIVHMRLAPGASLQASQDLGARVSRALLAVPGVRSVAQRTGRSARAVDPSPIFGNEFEVDLKPLSGSGQQRALKDIQQALTPFAGASFAVNTFLSERIQETLSGYTAPVVVKIYGKRLDQIDRLAQQSATVLSTLPGASNVQVQAAQGQPQLSIRLRQGALSRAGIAPADLLDTVQSAYAGLRVGQVLDGNRVFDVALILPPSLRQDPASVGALPISSPDGRQWPLSALADLRMSQGRVMVLHEDGQRVQVVTVNLRGANAAAFTQRAQQALAHRISWPPGTYPVFGGDAAAQSAATRQLLVHAAMALAGVIVLLYLALRSMRSVTLVLVNLPFALVGGVAVALAMGGTLSLGGLVGFVTLFGISVRNSIMLVSHYRYLVEVERLPWNIDTARRGAAERLVPILMTALVTALGLLPLALTAGAPGNEIEGSMAAVILGGLLTSTLLNLLVLPVLSARWLRLDAMPDGNPPARLADSGAGDPAPSR
ncbi:efflux RND transporter permease subunit [Dyella sp. KRB-257]|uniref:efflux RND transporter permease subunit n=1 Tax=Dyella sp. KRB-257 TaxID=3400915 RepID=UPI003C0A1F51